MSLERKFSRISPLRYQDFVVQVLLEEITYLGNLGNVSKDGLCFLSRENDFLEEVGAEVQGTVFWNQKQNHFFWEGKIIWSSPQIIRGEAKFLTGIQFQTPVNFSGLPLFPDRDF